MYLQIHLVSIYLHRHFLKTKKWDYSNFSPLYNTNICRNKWRKKIVQGKLNFKSIHASVTKELELVWNNRAKPMQKCLPTLIFKKCQYGYFFNFYAHWRISNSISDFVTFIKNQRWPVLLMGMKQRADLSDWSLTWLQLKPSGEHIPFVESSCLASTQRAESFVVIQASMNSAPAWTVISHKL